MDFLPLFLDPGILEDRGDNGYHVLKVLGMSLLGVEDGRQLTTYFGYSQRLDMYGQKMMHMFLETNERKLLIECMLFVLNSFFRKVQYQFFRTQCAFGCQPHAATRSLRCVRNWHHNRDVFFN